MKGLRVIALGAMLFAAAAAMGSVFTSNGIGGGNWNSSATWGGVGVPGSSDQVFVTSGDTVFVMDPENATSITVDSSATLRIDSGGVLGVSAAATALTVNAPATTGTSMLQFAGGTLTISNGSLGVNGSGSGVAKIQFTATGGTLSVKNDLTFTSSPNAQIDFFNSGTINIGGNLGSGGTITSTSSTFNFNGSGSQTINGPYTFNNLTIAKSAGTATLNASTFVNGNLTISSGIFDDGGNQITLNGGGTSIVNIGSSGVLKLGSGTSNTLFPVNVNPSNIFFSPGSAVSYHSALPQTINTAITYRRLFVTTVAGSVTHSFTGTLNVAEDLNVNNNGANTATLSVGVATLNVNTDISGDGTVSVSSGSISVGGNWNSTVGISTGSNSTVTYNGAGSQSVRVAGYYNLVINKSGGTATLAGATSTTNDLTVIGSGTLSTNGNPVTIGGAFSNTATFNAGSSTIQFFGAITNNGTVSASSATFQLNGTVHQVWSSSSNITLTGLQINNAAGASIGNNTTVNGSLLLNGGNVNLSGTFFIDVLCTVTRNSGWFLGALTMGFNPSPARRMHLGTSAAYLPIDIDANSAGTVTAQAVEGQHPNKTGTRVLARYWTIGASTVTSLDSVTFNYNASDVTSGLEMQFMLGQYSGAAWTRKGDVVSEVAHTATLTTVSGYIGDWVVGHAGSMGGAGKLYITQVNGGSSPYVNTPFSVDVQARTDDNTANGNAFSSSTVDVTLAAGSGSLGTMSGTLNAGSNFVTVSNLTYDTAESNVQLTAGTSSGDAIDSGTSAPFTVLAAPNTLTVTSINDSGTGTLREAIDLAEGGGCATPCTINFSTSGNIVLASDLTTITRSDLTIDGYSAPGASPNTNAFGLPSNAVITVSLDGASIANNGLTIFGQNVVVKGLAIKNCINDGVHFGGTNTGSAVVGCFIGTDLTGTVAAPNANGVGFTTSNSGTAGGTAAADRNVISGNSMYGIYAGTNSTNIGMYGNYIGVKANLTGALPNDDGIEVTQASTAMIGMLGGGNLISGNSGKGIEMHGSASILANLIGTNGTGTAAIPNDTGIYIGATANNVAVGPSELNVVSGNTSNGIELQGTNCGVNNAYVGVGSDGVTPIPNGGIGVRISGDGANNSVGATAANKIAHNSGGGVSVATSALGVGNVIRKNEIHSNVNGSLAIDLAEDGSSPNDATDSDLGPNNLQNFPTISSAAIAGGNVSLSVSVNSSGAATGTTNFIIDVYKADTSSPEQALEYLGNSGCVVGPVLTGYAFSVPAGTTVNGNKIVATATSYMSSCATVTDGTSELSAAVTATSDIHWINSSGGNWETASNWSPANVPTSSDTVYIDASGTYTVQINSAAVAGALHVGTGTTGTQTLNITGGNSLTLSSPSTVTTTGVIAMNGTLSGGGSLDVNGILDWNAGTISGVAALNINAGGTLNVNTGANHFLSQRLLTILAGGTANWLNGPWYLQTGGGIANYGTFDIKCDQSLIDNGADAGFNNYGTLRKSVTAGTTSFVSVDFFHNTGTLDIQTGALDVAAGSATSAITVSSGAELLINSDTFTLATGSSMTGAGKIHVTAGTLNVTGASVGVEHLYLAGGTVDGAGTITTGATGSYQWDSGTMAGTGSTLIATGGSMLMTSAGSKFLAQRTLTIQNGASVSFGGTGPFYMQNGGNIANAGIFDIVADAPINDNGAAGAIVNTNVFKKTGGVGGTTVINNITLNNSGTLNIQTGTLDPADVNNTGAIAIGGTLLINSNTFTMSAGTTVSGSGLLQVTSGTLTVNTGVTIANLQFDGGFIAGTGALVTNALTWNGGTMSGSGSTSIPNSGTATIATAANHHVARTFNVNFGATATYSGTGPIYMQSGGNINNAGTFDVTNNGIFADNGAPGAIANTGTFRKSVASGTATFSNIDFNHTGGTLDIQTGTLDLAGGTSSAAISIGSGAAFLVNSNTYQFAAGTTVSGSGTVYLTFGTLNVTGNVAIPQFNLGGGILDGAGTVTLTNTATWDSGFMQGGGTTTVSPSATLTIGSAGSHYFSNRTLTSASTATITYANNGPIYMQNGSSINNAGLFEITGDGSLNDNGGAASSFTNTGTLRRSTSINTATFSNITLNHNAGTIDILTGTLDLAAGTSNAAISIAGGAFFLVNSNTFTLASGTTVSGAGTLSLTGGTLNVTANVSVPQFTMSGGILDGTAILSLTNTADWSAGTMQGSGTTALASGATMTISTAASHYLNSRTISTTGTAIATVTGTGPIYFQTGGNIANGGTFVTDVDATFADNGSPGGFVNTGTFRKQTTTGTTTFSNLAFSNTGGLVDLMTGTLSVQSFTQTAAGTLKVRLGGTAPTAFSKLAVSSSPSLAGTLQVTLAGLYQPVGGDTFRVLTSPGGAHSGDFTQPYSYPSLSGGRTFSDAYDSSGLLLTVNGFADLTIAKTAPSNNFSTSSPITYTLEVNNTSPDFANGVSVTDTLPAGHTGIGGSGSGWTCNVVSLTVTCNANAALPSGIAPDIFVTATTPASPQTFINSATVSSSNDPNGTNNSGSWTITVGTPTIDLDLSSLSPASPVAQNTAFTFDFVIKNNGPITATGVVFTAPIPPEITYNSAAPDQGSCNFATNTVTCNLGTIASSAAPHVLLNLTTGTTPGTHYVTGSGTATETDSDPSNNAIPTGVQVIGSSLTVTNTNDAGAGSLRQALLDAANTSGCPAPCTIDFNITGSAPFTIQPQSDLPPVPASAIVDATTQPGYGGAPVIILDGTLTPTTYLLTLSNSNATVRGFSLINATKGLWINSDGNWVESNYIGITPALTAAANSYGIVVDGNNNRIGGTAGSPNTIANNTNSGIVVVTGVGNEITGNDIHANGTLGIDLGNDGTTANDAVDADTGANNLQNFPTVTAAYVDAANDIHIQYNIDSSGAANTGSILVEFFKADSIASGEGRNFLARTCFAFDAFGAGSSFNAPSVAVGDPIVMTATAYSDTNCTTISDGTSEFSNVVLAAACSVPPATLNAPPNACANSTSNSASVTAPTATQFDWTVTGGTLLTGQNTPNITFSAPTSGTVNISVTVRDNNGCPNTQSSIVNVIAAPTPTITGPTTSCAGSPITLDAGPGYTSYSWSTGATTQTISVSPTTNTTYTVIVSNGTCSGSDTHTVTVNPTPTVNITGATSSCSGTPVVLDAGAGFASYSWSTGATTQTITVSPTATTTYTVNVTNASGCAASDTHTINVNPTPTVNITGPTTSCSGSPITLDAGPGFATYAWSTGATTQTITVSPSATTTYTVNVTNGSGCTASDSHTVNVNPLPVVNITGPTTSCSGSPVTLDAGAGFASYSWSTGATTRTITASPSTTTTFSVNVTDGNGCTGSDTHTVTTSSPTVTITGPTTSCSGSPVVLDAGAGFSNYAWSTGATTRTITVSPSSTTTYSVNVTDATGCTATGTHTVSPGAAPDANVSAPLSVDANSTNNAASVPSQPGATYAWSISNGTITGGNGTNSILFTAGASGVVNLDITVSIGGCIASTAAGITINGSAPQSDFGVVKQGPSNVRTGDPIAWTIVVTNNGTAGATAQITDTLPSGVTVNTVNGGTWSCTTTSSQVQCAGFLAASTSNTIDVLATAPAQPGSITNSVVVQTSAGDSNPNNNAASVTTNVVATNLPPCSQTATLLSPANDANVTTSLVELRWIPPSNAAASRVWISRNGAPFASAGETNGDSLITYIPDGEVFWYVETLYNGCASTQSAQRRFVIPSNECNLHAPTILSPTNNSTTANALTNIQWTSEADAIAYEVWMSFEGAVPSLIGTTTNTSLTYLLPQSGAYDVFIRALGNRCGSRDSQTTHFRYQPPAECANRRRAILIAPLDGDQSASPVKFSWAPSTGATRYELYVVRGASAPQLVATTNTTETVSALNTGRVKWFVRAFFGENCSPMDSEPRELEIVNTPNACAALQPPAISTPGEISSGIEFLLQWTSRPGATAYQLQVASNSDFSGAETIDTTDAMHALTRTNNSNAPLAVYARVRAIDGRCTPPSVTAYGPIAAIFVLPRLGVIGSVPLNDPAVVHYTINLGPEFAGQTFTATPTEPWLTVTPTSGVVAPAGTNLDVTANGAGLGVGGHTGAVKITLNSAASRITTNATTSINPSININLVTPVQSTPANTPSPDTMIIPAVANADGINAHFQSDVRVANTSPQLIKYQLTFIPSGDSGITKGAQTTFSIEPGRTIALDDILRSFFGTGTSNAVGVLQIKPLTSTSSSTSSAAFGPLANLVSFASSRTFNLTPNGTFGQYVPAVPYANFADKSTVLSLQQIAQNAKTRSNLGLVEGSGNPADLLIRVFGGNGQPITSFTQHLNGGQHTQLNSFLFERGITLEDGRVEVQVTSSSGKVTAYASVLDNETSDAVLVTPVALGSTGNTKWVIPGVADIRSGFADWQSDVRVFNAGTETVNVTASFYSQSGGEPKVQPLTLAAGEVKQLDKILPNFFGVTNDGGALHLSTAKASRIVATSRTYNQTSKGTFGQFVNGVTPAEAVAVGTRPLQLLQVEESPRMRSNVGFAEVTGKPVKLEVTVTPPDAKFAAVIEVDLAANEFRQLGSMLAGLGLGDTYNARVSVRAISGEGRATAYASVIDLETNDPTFVFPQ